MKDKFVVITTDSTRRGVFGGILESEDRSDGGWRVILRDAQMALYWSQATLGVLGLAADGPAEGSRIGRPVPRIELDGVTAIIEATPDARKRWEAQPWAT